MNLESSGETNLVDRAGIVASIACAIHCMVAPLILVFAPLLGSWWVNPLTHVLIAALVLPLAIIGLRSGVRRHGRKWIVLVGGCGAALVLGGAILPMFGEASANADEVLGCPKSKRQGTGETEAVRASPGP